MKYVIFLTFLISFGYVALAQDSEDVEMKKIKATVQREVLMFKNKLSKERYLSEEEVEFSVDTFRINHFLEKQIDLHSCTVCINEAVYVANSSYDSLLNKYYTRLLKRLDAEDKKTLIKTQRTWLAYRDTEYDLIGMLRNDKYSGGGTIPSNFEAYKRLGVTIQRVSELAQHCANCLSPEERKNREF